MNTAREAAFEMKSAIARTDALNACGLTIRRCPRQSTLIWRNYLTGEEAMIAIATTTQEVITEVTMALEVVKAARQQRGSEGTREAA